MRFHAVPVIPDPAGRAVPAIPEVPVPAVHAVPAVPAVPIPAVGEVLCGSGRVPIPVRNRTNCICAYMRFHAVFSVPRFQFGYLPMLTNG